MGNFTTMSGTNSTWSQSDHDGELSAGAWTAVILMAILIVPIVFLNVTVVVVILKYKPTRTGSYLLILSLALADTCIGIFVILGHISGNFSEGPIGDIVCKLCSYASFTSEAASVASLTAISLDRVRAILWPLKPKLTNKKMWLIILGIWSVGLVYGLRGGFTFALKRVTVETDINIHVICIMNVSHDVAKVLMSLDFIFLFIIPAVIVTVCYVIILFMTRKHMDNIKSAHVDSNMLRRKKMKAVRMSLMMISIFVLLHLPKHAMLMYASSDSVVMPQSLLIISCFLIVSFLNSILNPILYGFLNPKIRNGFYIISKPCRCIAFLCFHTRWRSSHSQFSTKSSHRWIQDSRKNIHTPVVFSVENKDDSPKSS